MRHGHDMDSILAVAVDNLKWELLHAARAMAVVDLSESFGIGVDFSQREIECDTEVTCNGEATLRVPICGCLQFRGGFGMETNSHRQHRASRTIARGYPPNPQL